MMRKRLQNMFDREREKFARKILLFLVYHHILNHVAVEQIQMFEHRIES